MNLRDFWDSRDSRDLNFLLFFFRSIAITLHNVFDKDIKDLRIIMLNCFYHLFSSSPRATNSVRNFAIQSFGPQFRQMMDAYSFCIRTPYKLLLCDSHPLMHPEFRIRSNIFEDDGPTEIFLENKK